MIIEDLDLEGQVKTSSPVDFLLKINVPSGNAPTLAINPAGPINVAPFTPISFSVSGADIDGGAVVTLNTGGLPNGASMTPVLPISGAGSPGVNSTFAWTPQPADSGSYVITYSATDDTGAQAQASISINVSTLPEPTVTASPVTNITFNSATLNGIVNPNGVATTYRFEYGVNATYGNSTAPLSAGSGESGIAVTGALTGLLLSTEYHYRLVASSAGGTTATSDATFITAGPPNIPPTITLTAPANPTTITEIDPLIVTATATDQDGVIAKVEFFQGITKLGEDTTAPYEFDAGVFPVGTYLITAVATDDDGDSTVSGVATLNVIEAIPVAVDDHAFSSLTTTRINPRRNDTGPASLPLTIIAVGGAPTKGTASVIEGGLRVMYTSNAPLATNEFDSFTYTVRNSIGRESTATIFVHPAPLKGAQFAAHMKDHHGEVFGFVTYKFVRNGTFSGILSYDGKRYGILGTVTGDSPLILNIKRGLTVPPLPLEVSAGPIVDGSVTLSTEVLDPFGDEYWSGNAVYSPYSSANQSVRAGYYTVGFDSDPAHLGDTNDPQGGAGLSVRVVSDGSMRIVGRSPDGVGISFYGNLISGDRIPFYLATGPSARRGKWHGDMQFTTSGPELTADSEWTMPARDGTLLYPGGFTVAMPGVGCAYTRPTALEILGGPNVAFEFSDGGFLSPVTANLIIGTTPLIAGPAPLTTTRVNRVYGYISGQVRNVQAGGVQGFFGVALQHPALNRFQGSTYRKTSIGNFEGVVVP